MTVPYSEPTGKRGDLAIVWELVMLAAIITIPVFRAPFGTFLLTAEDWAIAIESEKMWVFGNVAIDKESKELRPDKNHIFWMEKKGIKPVALGVTTGKGQISEGIHYVSLTPCDIKEIKDNKTRYRIIG